LHKEPRITKQALMKNHEESTYALLVRSEEKSRTALETIAYSTCILSVIVAIWQFAHEPVIIPAAGIEPETTTASEVLLTNSPS
jgi:hypothetical protein